MPLLLPLLCSVALFAVGVYTVLVRRNAVLVLIGVELMLAAVNLELLAFDAWHADELHAGQVLALYVITIAAAEVGLGLAIVLLVFRSRRRIAVSELRTQGERGPDPGEESEAPERTADSEPVRARSSTPSAEGVGR